MALAPLPEVTVTPVTHLPEKYFLENLVSARADVLLINGEPTTDLILSANPSHNIALIVKDGAIVKNTVPTTLHEPGASGR
jgi:hypothetical protein